MEPVAAAEPESKQDDPVDLSGQFIRVGVTDVSTGSTLAVQILGDANVELVEEKMTEFSEVTQPLLKTFVPKKGAVCAAEFEEGCWYRARVEAKTEDGFNVLFLDYGNSAVLDATRLRPLDGAFASLAQVPACALQCTLSGLRAPRLDSEFYADSLANLQSLIMVRY